MPRIPLTFGPLDLESDSTSKRDGVLSLLINGYRVGKDIHMWPDRAEYCDVGAGAPVYIHVSLLHGAQYAVSAGNLYQINAGAATLVSAGLFPIDARPTWTEDAKAVFVAARSPIYRVSGGTATAIAGGQAPLNVTSLGFVSGFLVANGDDPAGGGLPGDFAYSDTVGGDGIPTYAVWSYENNANKPDALQALVATPDGNLYAIGVESVDVSYLSGSVDNPFATNTGAAQPFGTPAHGSVVYDSQSIYYLSVIQGNRQVVRLIGGREPQIIGFPVTVPVQDCERVDDAQGFVVGFRGQSFYVLTFPTANVTIEGEFFASLTVAFSLRSQEWYVLGEWQDQFAQHGAYIGCSFAYDGNVRYIGSKDGKIYTIADRERVENPLFVHRWRNNRRLECSNGRQIGLGAIGERRLPLRTRGCGRYYSRQDELVFTQGSIRMVIRTGWRDWGKHSAEKISDQYAYDVKRGDVGVVFNGIDESFEVTRV